MRPDTTLVLGNFQFAGTEIPESIPVGGQQELVVHRLPGGARVVNAMGQSDRPPEWTGLFLGANAVTRALALDAIRKGGQQQTLTWGQFNYLVVVRDFQADYRNRFRIPYHIVCEVVQDNTTPVTDPANSSVDDAVSDDLGAAQAQVILLQAQQTAATAAMIGAIQSAVLNVGTAVAGVTSFANASKGSLSPTLQALGLAQAAVGNLSSFVDTSVGGVSGFAGMAPFTPPVTLAASLTNVGSLVSMGGTAAQLASLLGRMSLNIGAVVNSQTIISTAGGNLFSIAEQQYGDASAWTGIARANNLVDPFIVGPTELGIPLQPDTEDGVLSA